MRLGRFRLPGSQLTIEKSFHTVDGRNPAPVIGSLSHYLRGFIHPRWCRLSSINSIKPQVMNKKNATLHFFPCGAFFPKNKTREYLIPAAITFDIYLYDIIFKTTPLHLHPPLMAQLITLRRQSDYCVVVAREAHFLPAPSFC